MEPNSEKDVKRVQKTFVTSRKSLASLEKAAQKANASKDALVEISIQRLLPIIFRERQKNELRKEILNQINHFLEKGVELLTKFETDLGDDDPTTIHFKSAIKALASAYNEISAFVDKGNIIENFNFQHLAVSTQQPDGQGYDNFNKNS